MAAHLGRRRPGRRRLPDGPGQHVAAGRGRADGKDLALAGADVDALRGLDDEHLLPGGDLAGRRAARGIRRCMRTGDYDVCAQNQQ